MSPGLLAAGRRAATAQMVDTCVIGIQVRSDQLDETTGEYPVTIQPVYAGPCRFTLGGLQVRDVDSQGQDLAIADATLAIPTDQPGSGQVGKDHVATITLAANDDATITAVVQAGHAQTWATARRFPVLITT